MKKLHFNYLLHLRPLLASVSSASELDLKQYDAICVVDCEASNGFIANAPVTCPMPVMASVTSPNVFTPVNAPVYVDSGKESTNVLLLETNFTKKGKRTKGKAKRKAKRNRIREPIKACSWEQSTPKKSVMPTIKKLRLV